MACRIIGALFMVMTGTAAIAQTAAPGRAEFRIGEDSFTLPLPAGYCLPSGSDVEVARQASSLDPLSATPLILFACDGGSAAPDYFSVKVLNATMIGRISRADLLSAIGPSYDNPQNSAALSSGAMNAEMGNQMSDAMGTRTEIEPVLEVFGHDDTCAYFGGRVLVKTAAGAYSRAVASCITSVSGKVVVVSRYDADGGPDSPKALLPKVKAFALSIAGTTPN